MLANAFQKIVIAALLLSPIAAPLAVLAATPPAVQAEQSPTMPGPAGLGHGPNHGNGGKLAGLLNPQQRAMLMLQMRDQIKNMSPADRKAFRKTQTQKLLAMSAADRQKFASDLQAKWDALPQPQKDRLQQRLARQAAPASQAPNAQ